VSVKRKTATPTRPAIHLSLTCSCGGTISGTVSPTTAAIKMRDVYLSFHRDDGHTVTDNSKDVIR
jgi:hypothetical protein